MSADKQRRDADEPKLSALSRAPKPELDPALDPYLADAEGMPPECENMLPLHKHICRSAAITIRKTEIASLMGVSVEYVTKVLDRDDAKSYMRYLTTKAEDRFLTVNENIQRAAGKALDKKLAILEYSNDDRLVDKVASDLLDRGGFKAPDRLEVITNKVITAADIRALREEDETIQAILDD